MTAEPRSTGLRSLSLASRYRSNRGDVVQGFYLPAFQVACSYSRAVGYFTSTSLALYSRGIENLAERGGTMRLIASPHLNEDDILDIERGYDFRSVITRATERALAVEDRGPILDGLGQLGRLIADGRLDIKLAFVAQEGRIGIYHEKLGIFRDSHGDLVAFTGSSNETLGGLASNFESIEVYRGWVDGDSMRALDIEQDFDELWSNQTPSLSVETFPDVSRDRLIKLGQERTTLTPPRDDALVQPVTVRGKAQRLSIPDWMTVRDYQRAAVKGWLLHRGRGILKMATGTGKTKTSLIAATKLADVLRDREEALILVVVAPLQHLVDQWVTEVEDFGVRPIPVYESSQKWLPLVEEQLAQVRFGQRPIVAMVATNASFAGAKFQSILSRITQPLLVIADEAHNLGSPAYRTILPTNATYRLALSATPERWFDDEGTDALVDYFGPVVYELGLGDAIEMGALCRYNYFPRLVELNDVETELYVELSRQIARCFAAGSDDNNPDSNSQLGQLLRKRAGVLGHAAGKIDLLRKDIGGRANSWFQLAYCAEGSRPSHAGEPPGPNQLSEVMNVVGNELNLAAHPYISETPRRERKVLLHRFATGDDLRVLVAMRCLDEGVDIPDAQTGYLLASSSNPRQFIQRRGRLLRRAEGKDHAEIFDYLAVPPTGAPVDFEIERRLLIRELERANEFGKLSENYEATLKLLRPLKDRYQLMHL
ncbi:DEAD/DEAH box helicase family protein [Hoyosella rhizosphaerae]|uniref:DNA-repair protein n=1 Tax=Hoyosella rhizosphaerae TaxID=1755582 RepID=A0A916U1X9_9ACTN|nr:DEAD/DEAH box helicase family protein [Hoyosella rhizosphaerae]MBN4927153.1 DEAD/DEAH box helicase family protein [Hoyosella rhizosphaerae]GGC53579.1 DNA-repair protein [Hoyosella rhizosphaerae]